MSSQTGHGVRATADERGSAALTTLVAEAAGMRRCFGSDTPGIDDARRLADAIVRTAQAADDAGLRGLNYLVTLIAPYLRRHPGGDALAADLARCEAWVDDAVAFCSARLRPDEASRLVARLVDWPGLSAIPPQVVTLISQRLADDARALARMAGTDADPPASSPESPTPPGDVREFVIARDEFDLLMEACEFLVEELGGRFSRQPLPAQGADSLREWSDLLDDCGERFSRLASAARYLGADPLERIAVFVESQLAQLRERPDGLDEAARQAVLRVPAALVAWCANPEMAQAQVLSRQLADDGWPAPLALDAAAALARDLSGVRCVAKRPATSGEAPMPFEPAPGSPAAGPSAALSLDVDPHADASVVDQMMREVPVLAGALIGCIEPAGPGADIAQARRIAHRLQGVAGAAGARGIARLIHAMEDLLQRLSEDGSPANPTDLGLLKDASRFLLTLDDAIGVSPAAQRMLAELIDRIGVRLGEKNAPPQSDPRAAELDPLATAPDPRAPEHEPPREPSSEGRAADPPARVPDSPASAREDAWGSEAPSHPVDLSRLEAALAASDELVAGLAGVEAGLESLEHSIEALRDELDPLESICAELERFVDARGLALTGRRSVASSDLGERAAFDALHSISERLAVAVSRRSRVEMRALRHVDSLRTTSRRLARDHGRLRESAALAARAGVAQVVPRLRRTVREAALLAGCEVELVVIGESIEMDMRVLYPLVDPLVQLLRNAVDHGIASDRRGALGDIRRGRIEVEFVADPVRCTVSVRDDGPGLDRPAIVARARAQGLHTAAGDPDDRTLEGWLTSQGFSTRAQRSQLSGRGLGLDIVAQAVASLGGQLRLHDAPGQGLEVTMSIPQRLAAISVAVVRGPSMAIALMLDAETVLLESADPGLATVELEAMLGMTSGALLAPDASCRWLSVQSVHAPGGVLVRIPQPSMVRTVNVRPLPRRMAAPHGMLGVTVLADGAVAAVIDPAALLAQAGPDAGACLSPGRPIG